MLDRTRSTGTVARIVRLMKQLAEAEGNATISGLSEQTALPPSTVHRLLDLLAGEGMVERDRSRPRYRVGSEFFRMAALVSRQMPVGRLALPIMQQAVAAHDEACYLCLLMPAAGRMMFAEAAEPSHLLSYRIPLNQPLSLLWGASGRSILAHLPEDEARLMLKNERAAGRPDQELPAWTALRADLAAIRALGCAVSHGQRIKGAVGIFAPVFDVHGNVAGSLGFTIPELRFDPRREPGLSRAVILSASRLSRALGCSESPLAKPAGAAA